MIQVNMRITLRIHWHWKRKETLLREFYIMIKEISKSIFRCKNVYLLREKTSNQITTIRFFIRNVLDISDLLQCAGDCTISHTELSVLAALNLCKRLNFTRFL